MKIKGSYTIDYDTFLPIYRIHNQVKFHLHRYMILSVLLLCIGEFLEKGMHMEFGALNSMVLILVFASIGLNLLADFILPKQAYKNLQMACLDHGVITIQEQVIIFGEGSQKVEKNWSRYTSCVETETAFLLYQKDQFTIIPKQIMGDHIDDVRSLLKDRVNKGKSILFKK